MTAHTRIDAFGLALGRAVPIVVALVALLLWELVVRANDIPAYVLPAPSLIAATLVRDWPTLAPALGITLEVTSLALLLAVVGGVLLAVLFTLSRWLEVSLFPFAVILQVTPIVAIAPLIVIYVSNVELALVICAWIVAFFPIVANTVAGLKSADRNLVDLFTLYGATRLQRLLLLLAPSALPYFLAGLRIAGGLALIGAIVAEFAAGTSGKESGLAYRIVEAGFRLNVPRMYAALALLAACGVVIYFVLDALSRLLLRRWHESALADR